MDALLLGSYLKSLSKLKLGQPAHLAMHDRWSSLSNGRINTHTRYVKISYMHKRMRKIRYRVGERARLKLNTFYSLCWLKNGLEKGSKQIYRLCCLHRAKYINRHLFRCLSTVGSRNRGRIAMNERARRKERKEMKWNCGVKRFLSRHCTQLHLWRSKTFEISIAI